MQGNSARSANNTILLPRARNFSEPPTYDLRESNSKNLFPIDPNNFSMSSSQFVSSKPLMNLKQVLLIEEKLYETLEKLRQNKIDKSICDEYWALTEDSSVPSIEKIFSEKRTQTVLKHACIVELATIAYSNICFSEKLSLEIIQQFRNLYYYIHQNFLSLMRLMLHRCSNDSLTNTWTHVVRERVQEREIKVNLKGGVSGLIKHHTALSCKILENIANLSPQQYRPALLNMLKCLYCPTYQRARKFLENLLIGMPTFAEIPEETQSLPTVPYLGPSSMPYTLILDLDETLVHYVDNGPDSKLNVRPGCSEFLNEAKKYFEIVIFTAALQDYADWAIDSIDTHKAITHRLYRQHTIPTGPVFIKDLSRVGRDLSKVIIVDNVAENFRLQAPNGLFIKSWFEDINDTCLKETLHLLREIAMNKVSDVRVALRNYRDQILRQMIRGVNNPHLNLLTTQ